MQVTAGSPERRGLTQAGAAVGDSQRPERIEAGRPQEQGSSKDSKWAGGYILGRKTQTFRPPSRQRLPCAQIEAETQELRPNWAAACGAASAGHSGAGADREGVATGKERKASTDGQKGPTWLWPGLTLAW